MVFSMVTQWLARIAARRRLLDELADLTPEQLQDAGLNRSDLALPRGIEPDGVMLQRVGWRADRPAVQPRANTLRMAQPAPRPSPVGLHPLPRCSVGAALVMP